MNLQSKWGSKPLKEQSTTMTAVELILRTFEQVGVGKVDRLLELGCGHGSLGKAIGERLGAKVIHGIDIDPIMVDISRSRGLLVHQLDLELERLPFPDAYFDFVVSGGLMEHLVYFDNVLQETSRVLRLGGYCLFSMPNLGSWMNLLLLPFGYQPRDVEVSRRISAGCFATYSKKPIGHVHSVTVRAFHELMEFYGFRPLKVSGFRPRVSYAPLVFRSLDFVLSRRASLARRFMYLGTKCRDLSFSRS